MNQNKSKLKFLHKPSNRFWLGFWLKHFIEQLVCIIKFLKQTWNQKTQTNPKASTKTENTVDLRLLPSCSRIEIRKHKNRFQTTQSKSKSEIRKHNRVQQTWNQMKGVDLWSCRYSMGEVESIFSVIFDRWSGVDLWSCRFGEDEEERWSRLGFFRSRRFILTRWYIWIFWSRVNHGRVGECSITGSITWEC